MVDILAIGIHPDDIELSCSATLVKHIDMGYSVALCDMTMGELGTRGSGELRIVEAESARKIIGATHRVNLRMQDGFAYDDTVSSIKIIEIIRHFKPKIILSNAIKDRHPDHQKGYEMVKKAVFLSGLPKIATEYKGDIQEAHRPNILLSYIQSNFIEPDIVVDVSDYYDTKLKSIMAYSSQFYNPNSKEQHNTFISDESFLDFIKAKDIIFGKTIGVKYAEGFKVDRYIGVNSLFDLK